jgi:hypothetical protein
MAPSLSAINFMFAENEIIDNLLLHVKVLHLIIHMSMMLLYVILIETKIEFIDHELY